MDTARSLAASRRAAQIQRDAALSLDPHTPHQKLMAKIPQAQQQCFTKNFSLQCFKCFSQASLSLEKDLKVT